MLQILLILIFFRPFIPSLVNPCADAVYSFLFFGTLILLIARKGLSTASIGGAGLPLACFGASLVVSCIFSYNRAVSVEQAYRYAQGILALFVISSLAPDDKKKIIKTLVAASVIVSLLAIYQYLVGFRSLARYMETHGIINAFASDYIHRRRPFLPFVTPNALAGYLAMMTPLFFAHRQKTWMLWLPCVLVALLLTQSVGAIVSLCAGCVIYLFLQGRLTKKYIFFIVLMAAVAGLIVVSRSLTQQTHTRPAFSAGMRLNYWKAATGIIASHPVTGVGIGNFNLPQSRYAHNSYLQLWAETGTVGIATFIWLIVALFAAGYKKLRNTEQKQVWAALLTAISIFLLHNLLDFTFFLPDISLLWWIIAAVALG